MSGVMPVETRSPVAGAVGMCVILCRHGEIPQTTRANSVYEYLHTHTLVSRTVHKTHSVH